MSDNNKQSSLENQFRFLKFLYDKEYNTLKKAIELVDNDQYFNEQIVQDLFPDIQIDNDF